ncbi:Laminin subunit alpha-1 [Eumeta japonica]|uniref:Laminin subunit alpha-1 n=1 Tax=Eumeta variegata TaxID=151549 RepID=A0A4C1ZVN6_EUMVA|nr:Laminin subunit alpha-1 [Eumeta japonica]
MKVGSVQWRCDRYVVRIYGVSRKDRSRKSDVRERCVLKEDVETRIERGKEMVQELNPVAQPYRLWIPSTSHHYHQLFEFYLLNKTLEVQVDGWKGFFWLTELWNGTQLDAYGGSLVFRTFWDVMRGDTGGVPTAGPDVVLITNDGVQIASANTSYEEPGSREISVPLVEGQWYRFAPDEDRGETLTRAQLMDALSDVRALMLRAQFHSDEDEVRLEGVRVVGAAGETRDVCACPVGYAGAHCEQCAWSHARLERAPGAVPRFECVPCPCNGHAECDAAIQVVVKRALAAAKNVFTDRCSRIVGVYTAQRRYSSDHISTCIASVASTAGVPAPPLIRSDVFYDMDGTCGECHHNTTGSHCERCLPGHYGNPTVGPCRPCACPLLLPSNNFSPNCALAAAEGDDYVCTQCPQGYTGDHCEFCDFGYWGFPTTPGGACAACACDGAPCDQHTGECLKCPPHAGGIRCDQCEESYWQNPNATVEARVGVVCQACACGPGALSPACDQRTGQCACREGWAGPACDRCDHGYGNPEGGCPACRCGVAALSPSCDSASGFCACAAGAATPSCDACLPEHYGLTDAGCTGNCYCTAEKELNLNFVVSKTNRTDWLPLREDKATKYSTVPYTFAECENKRAARSESARAPVALRRLNKYIIVGEQKRLYRRLV